MALGDYDRNDAAPYRPPTLEGNSMSWIVTHRGTKFDLLSPRPQDVAIEDIAHALSLICRFNGHVSRHYSVAQHSVIVSTLVPPRFSLAGLLHDAAEAYMGDFTRPLKRLMGNVLLDIEIGIEQAIESKFGVTLRSEAVKFADDQALALEREQLLPTGGPVWEIDLPIAPAVELPVLSPAAAERLFLNRFNQLTIAKV